MTDRYTRSTLIAGVSLTVVMVKIDRTAASQQDRSTDAAGG